ncbi:MAG: hypothetical protein OSB09_01000 [Planctomycetota bacterium]|nr:hypothetical protein [Planctomycetota bacterium]
MAKRSKPSARKTKRGGSSKKNTPKLVATAPTSGGIPVVCSECYSDFLFMQNSSSTSANCPICMHSGQVPDSGEIARISMAKASEKKALISASVPGILFILIGLIYLMQLNSAGSTTELGPALNYSLLGGTILFFLITLVFAARYEKSRSEIYF